MCESEEELKTVNSDVQNNKEKEVKVEKAVSEVKEAGNVVNNVTVSEIDLDWDDSIPF